jgi:NAD(P)H dehydrogenase (quinone)
VVNVAIIYYSSTGTVDAMARRAEQAAVGLGCEVRRRHVQELAPESAVAENEDWRRHLEEIGDEPTASAEDLVWADAVLLGSPTRYGNIAAQLKQYLDGLGGEWAEGRLADKAYAGFTSSMTTHGGQESTLLALYNTIYHFGGVIVPPGYTDPVKFADGNPYGASHVTGGSNDAPLGEQELDALDHLVDRVVTVGRALASIA